MQRSRAFLTFAVLLVCSWAAAQTPVGTAFSYQGRLTDAGAPANGSYDLSFSLYGAASAGSQIGSTLTKENVAVTNGLFTVSLDFGSSPFAGSARWLQIGVRPGASNGSFTALSTRQELTPTPNAIQVPWSGVSGKPAGFADGVDNDSGGDITGVAAGSGLAGGGTTGNVTLGLDTATTDGRYVLKAGDAITGTLTLNPASGVAWSTTADVNLEGRIMRGGTPLIQASTVLASTALGEAALVGNAGANNTGTGYHALTSNTTGTVNTATGHNALWQNTTGNYNTATGGSALPANTTGTNNTATGFLAMQDNTTGNANTATGAYALQKNSGGGSNVAVGEGALHENLVGGGNVAAGYSAGFGITGNANIAIGYEAGSSATTGSSNIYIANPGVAAESNTIRLGTGGTHTSFFAAGISGVPLSSAALVGVTSEGRLGAVAAGAGSSLDADMVDGQHASAFFSGSLGGEVTGTQAATVVSNAVATNTADAIVRRDGLGNFLAGTVGLAGTLVLPNTTSASVGMITLGGARFLHNFGNKNTFVGSGSGNTSTTGGGYNSAFGSSALESNTTGRSNAAVGGYALSLNTAGDGNAAVGFGALDDNTTGGYNSAFGHTALHSNTTAYYNSAVGFNALGSTTTGGYNSAFGIEALYQSTTGTHNVAVGYKAGFNLTSGDGNIYIANLGLAAESSTIRIGTSGTHTLFFAAGISGVPVSSAALVGVTSAGQLGTVAAGAGSSLDADTVDGQHASAFMGAALDNWVNTTGDAMTGTLTLNPVSGVGLSTTADINLEGRVMRGSVPFIQADTALGNTTLGENALSSNTTGQSNTATGTNALEKNTEGLGNTAIGANALEFNTTGSSNTATGMGTLTGNLTGDSNTATGNQALNKNASGGSNTATGQGALFANSDGTANTAIGVWALAGNTSGNENTAMGAGTLESSTGSGNIALGYMAGTSATTGSSNIYIANPGVAAESNTIRLGTGGTHTSFFAAGISGVPVSSAALVGVTGAGQLGTVAGGAGSGLDADTLDGQHASAFFSGSLGGEVTGTQAATVVSNAVAANTASAIVRRDASGNFLAGTVGLAGTLGLPNTTSASAGMITLAGARFLHNFGTENTFAGTNAGNTSMTGVSNSAFGYQALWQNTEGTMNHAFGVNALYSNTTGNYNSAFGSQALYSNTDGVQNTAVGLGALFLNASGDDNSAVGMGALLANTIGDSNSGFGSMALWSNTEGSNNSAAGAGALWSSTKGNYNSALGSQALYFNTEGNSNSAVGHEALSANTGDYNSAFGDLALSQKGTGARNVAIGSGAGYSLTSGDDNIYIANTGDATESGIIRIGTTSTHTATYIAGISGATSASGAAVFVNSDGQLGTTTSSRRSKEQIADMDSESDVLMKLRPVSFYYRPELDETHTRQYGLVAEEVAELAPELVLRDETGAPQTVRYHFVNAMLLNEVQKQRRQLKAQDEQLQTQGAMIRELESELAAIQTLKDELARLEARLR